MKEIIRLYTDTFKGNFPNSRNLLFLSEGYKASDEALLYKNERMVLIKNSDTTLPAKTRKVSLFPICEISLNNLSS